MRNPAGHLTDHFHLLSLQEGRFYLLSLCNLLPQLLIGLLELLRSLPYKILQMCREMFALKQMILHLVLTSAGTKRGPNGAHQAHGVKRTFEHGYVAKAIEQTHPVLMGRVRGRAACQYDKMKVRPWRLAGHPT